MWRFWNLSHIKWKILLSCPTFQVLAEALGFVNIFNLLSKEAASLHAKNGGIVEVFISLNKKSTNWNLCVNVPKWTSVCKSVAREVSLQISARVSKKSQCRHFCWVFESLGLRKTLNCSLGKISVSLHLKMCSFTKSRSRRNTKFESQKKA